MVLVVIFSFGRRVHDRLDWQGQVREQHAGKGFIRNLTLHGHTTNHLDLLLHCDWLVALVRVPKLCDVFHAR